MEEKLKLKDELRGRLSTLFPAQKHEDLLISLFLARDKKFFDFLKSWHRIPSYLLYVVYNVDEELLGGLLFCVAELGVDDEDCKVAIRFLELIYGDEKYVPTDEQPLSEVLSKKVSANSWASLYELQSLKQAFDKHSLDCVGEDAYSKLCEYFNIR